MKKVAIMQPYFLPYIGYFQLLNSVDEFIIYDNIQFSKRGWIHRNRILQNGKDVFLGLPIKKDSDYLDVKNRVLADSFEKDKTKLISKIRNIYLKAPQFNNIFPIVETIMNYESKNLFEFVFNSVITLAKYLNINTPITISSNIDINHDLKGEDKVKALVKAVEGTEYINAIGGKELYSKEDFLKEGIILKFIKTTPFVYEQFKNEFIPFLSIIDVLMFNDLNTVKIYLEKQYEFE